MDLSFLEKFATLIKSRRFWVTVITVAVSIIVVYNGIAGAFGWSTVDEPDAENVADQIMPYAEAVATIISALILLLGGTNLVNSYTTRPAGKDDR